ncbi:hypothetical protein ACFLXI_04825 [Chloroflexota bacterium]
MVENLIHWFTDRIASSDIIDLYFILSDIVDTPLSKSELCETAYLDSVATYTTNSIKTNKIGEIPLGKLVF